MTSAVIGIVACTLLAGYFSGIETGMYSINRLRIRFRAEQGERGAIILQKLASDMERLLATTLVGHNMAIHLATAILISLIRARSLEHAEIIATALLTPFAFVVAELIPKDLFERRREALLCPLAPSLRLVTLLFWPVVAPLRGAIHLLMKCLRRPQPESDLLFSRQGLMFSLADAAGLGRLTPAQRRMAQSIMEIEHLTVGGVRLPIERIRTASADTPPGELLEQLREAPLTRLPVYDPAGVSSSDPPRIIGTVNVFDLLYARGELADSLRPYVKPAVQLDAEMRLYPALMKLRAARQRMGMVVAGERTIGIITINGIVRRMLGELGPAARTRKMQH